MNANSRNRIRVLARFRPLQDAESADKIVQYSTNFKSVGIKVRTLFSASYAIDSSFEYDRVKFIPTTESSTMHPPNSKSTTLLPSPS